MNNKIYITADKIATVCTDRNSQETSISWSRDDEKITIESSDITFITKMKNIMLRDPDHYRCYYYSGNVDKNGSVYAYVFEIDKKLLSFRVAQKRRELSAEEKQERSERLHKK